MRVGRAGRWVWALVATSTLACGADEPPVERELPKEWYTASVDPRGGRYLPEAHAELRRFQAATRASGAAVPYGHFDDSRTVAFAIKTEFIPTGTRRRLGILLEHEADDPELSLVALVDRPRDEVLAALDLPGAERLITIPAALSDASDVSFQFLRDYAPIVRVRHGPEGPETVALAAYRGSTLNKVVDARLGVRINRAATTTEIKHGLTRQLASWYRLRLGGRPAIGELRLRMDGGNVLSDGVGTCFATAILLAKNGGDRPFVETELRESLGCLRSVFLAAPQRLDFIQHVDTLLYLADEENAVLSMPTLYESDKIHEFQNVRVLLELGYKVHRVPRPTASITYTNILTTRDHVYVPQFHHYKIESREQASINQRVRALDRGGHTDLAAWYLSRPVDTKVVPGGPGLAAANRHARDVIQRLFPRKQVVSVRSDETLETQGAWHCLSHELPESLGTGP